MLVSSATTNSYNQNSNSNNKNNIQIGNGEYIHTAVRYSDADKIIEFRDKETDRKIQFYSDSSMEKMLQRKFGTDYVDDGSMIHATGVFEKYLQDMWSYQVSESNTVDNNNDGYLDAKEMANSKRGVKIDFNETTKKFDVNLSTVKDKYGTEEKAIEVIERAFKKDGFTDGKISVDQDFNLLLYVDSNLDAKIEDMEILADMPPEKLINQKGLTLGEKTMLFSMLDEWRKKREKDNDTISSSADSINTIKAKDNILNKLLSNEADMSKLSEEEKSVFLQNRKSAQNSETFSMEQLLQIKERLKVSSKYINTQVNSAQIFSLKL